MKFVTIREEEGLEDALASLRRARALQTVSRLRRQAAAGGARELTTRQITAEVRAVRRVATPAAFLSAAGGD